MKHQQVLFDFNQALCCWIEVARMTPKTPSVTFHIPWRPMSYWLGFRGIVGRQCGGNHEWKLGNCRIFREVTSLEGGNRIVPSPWV